MHFLPFCLQNIDLKEALNSVFPDFCHFLTENSKIRIANRTKSEKKWYRYLKHKVWTKWNHYFCIFITRLFKQKYKTMKTTLFTFSLATMTGLQTLSFITDIGQRFKLHKYLYLIIIKGDIWPTAIFMSFKISKFFIVFRII